MIDSRNANSVFVKFLFLLPLVLAMFFSPIIFALVIVSGLVGVVRELTHDYLPRNDHASDTQGGVSVTKCIITK